MSTGAASARDARPGGDPAQRHGAGTDAAAAAQAARLLRFLVLAAGARSVVAVRPGDAARAALSGLAVPDVKARHPVTVVEADSADELPQRVDLVYLGQAADPFPVGAGILAVAADEHAVEAAEGDVAAWARTGPSDSAPGLRLVFGGGGPSSEALATLHAIEETGRKVRPSRPMPPDAGGLLYVLLRARRSRNALEIGTSEGASTIWLASALQAHGGSLISVERDSARHSEARRNLKRAGLEQTVDLRLGEAARWLPRLEGKLDFVLLDEDPADRGDHLTALLGLLAPRSFVVAHSDPGDRDAVARYGALVRTLPGTVATATVAAGHGLTLTLMT